MALSSSLSTVSTEDHSMVRFLHVVQPLRHTDTDSTILRLTMCQSDSSSSAPIASSTAWQIVQVLSAILEHVKEDDTLANAARVSRDWEAPALRVLWHTVVDPALLFALLGEVKGDSSTKELVRTISTSRPKTV